jgi:hypothetical protein
MSALAWLFGFGALAVAFPLLLHLIRRTPRGQTQFSSLMFLTPTPPTLTRRSRLDNLWLLLMRAAAICLIAFAFMRPYFRGADTLSEFEVANRRVAILLDTSASMRRSGLWDQAKQQVEKVLGGLEKGDDIALLTFDSSVQTIVDFENEADPAGVDQAGLIRNRLKPLEPSWSRSDLGRAMVSVAENLDVWRDSQRAKDANATSKLQIVVISDMQTGSKIDALQSYQWPAPVFVKFQPVIPADFSNATVQVLDPAAEEDDPVIRVRVANSEQSSVDQFFVDWSGADGASGSVTVSYYVPPGTSRVLKISPDIAISAQQFTVTGDPEDFDNQFFVAPAEPQVLSIVYIGDDKPDDPAHPQYYLRRALIETPSRITTIEQLGAGEQLVQPGGDPPTLVVLASPVDESQRAEIDGYLNSGGTLMVVMSDGDMVENTTSWTGARSKNDDVENRNSKTNYMMLAEIDFADALFHPFANPRYNDFTKIRFWKHQSVEFLDDESVVIARFENDDPAVWSRATGKGQVYTLASGWQPQQSQLALSSKFVPLINGLVEIAADFPELDSSLWVGESIEFPAGENQYLQRLIIKPDGSREIIETDQTRFVDVDQPGIYRLISRNAATQNQVVEAASPDSTKTDSEPIDSDPAKRNLTNAEPNTDGVTETLFAVNVDRAESETSAITVAQIEMFQVNVGEQKTAAGELAQMREMRERDIEDRQKIWKWLIVAAIVLLIGETWLAGWTGSRTIADESGLPASGLSGELA